MKPCKTCNRINTIHNLVGTCNICDPPEPEQTYRYNINSHEYEVTGLANKAAIEHFINQQHHYNMYVEKRSGRIMVNIPYDTGRCGKQALQYETVELSKWLARVSGAKRIV